MQCVFAHGFNEMLYCYIERVAASATGGIVMPAAFKVEACKGIHVEIALAAEAPFPFFIAVNYQGGQFYTLNAQG